MRICCSYASTLLHPSHVAHNTWHRCSTRTTIGIRTATAGKGWPLCISPSFITWQPRCVREVKLDAHEGERLRIRIPTYFFPLPMYLFHSSRSYIFPYLFFFFGRQDAHQEVHLHLTAIYSQELTRETDEVIMNQRRYELMGLASS